MTVLAQIAIGSFLLILCTVIHLRVIAIVLSIFRNQPARTAPRRNFVRFLWL